MSAQVLILDTETKRDRAAKIVSQLPVAKPLKLTVEPFRARRSNTQNARHWLLLQKVAAELGMSPDDIHEVALCRYFGYEEKKVGGIIRQIPLERSRVQDVKRFAEFARATEEWIIHEFGIFLD
jgi:hypothetical protein